MPVFRYSPEGIERAVKKVRLRTFMFVGLALASSLLLVSITQGLRSSLIAIPIVVILMGVGAFMGDRSARKTIQTMEIEIDESTLSFRSSVSSLSIPRSQVTRLSRSPGKLAVKGRSARETITISTELGGEELAKLIENWVPAEAVRAEMSPRTTMWTWVAVIGFLALLLGAYAIDSPTVAFSCSLLAAVCLVASAVWTWSMKSVSLKFKLRMLVVVLPIFGLLARAWNLWMEARV